MRKQLILQNSIFLMIDEIGHQVILLLKARNKLSR